MTAPEKGFQTKPNTGALFRDERKANDTDRDYSGTVNVSGTEYWLSGWIKTSAKGNKYLSLSLKPKETAKLIEGGNDGTKTVNALNDQIPF